MMEPLPNQIATLMLEDLRQAAMYLEELGESPDTRGQAIILARRHASRLWSACQALERLMVALEQLMVRERSRRAYEGNGEP